MWIYVSTSLTASASAPAEAVSTEPSNWQSHVLAQSCLWRGKLSPSLLWSRRLKTVSWLQRLSGAMCEPSRADVFAASWMASLAESRARNGASLASAAAIQASAISGRQPDASSSNLARGSASSRMSRASSPLAEARCLAPNAYVETYVDWVSRLWLSSSARRTWASRMSESASSSSGSTTSWPTAQARDHFPAHSDNYIAAKKAEGHGMANLNDIAVRWPTPAARDGKGVDRQEIDRGNARPLNEVASSWGNYILDGT